MLLIATLGEGLPYGYYTLLRLVEFVSCCIIFIHLVKKSSTVFTLLFGLLGLVFNPIFKIPFERDVWIIVDVCAIVLWVIFLIVLGVKQECDN